MWILCIIEKSNERRKFWCIALKNRAIGSNVTEMSDQKMKLSKLRNKMG